MASLVNHSDINCYHSCYNVPMPNPDRTALLIRCSKDEAERIRQAARNERRTVSAYVLQAVMNRLSVDKRLQEMKQNAATRGSKY
jgi:uncharacterized protein (DUF1778 family)